VLSAGFWLSITAVAGLVVAGTGGIGRPGRLRQLAAAQWAVSWALCLPGLMVFGGLPLYGPLVNLVAVPLFGLVVVPLALAGLLALAFSERLAASLWRLLAPILEGFLDGLEAVAEMPGAWQQPATVPGWALAVAGMAALALLLPFGRPVRFAWLLVLVPVLWWRPSALPAGAYRVTVLDVGQGLAVVVETRRRVLVFDTGPAWRSGRDAGAAVVVPFLRGAGIEQVDALVLSHGDGDHRGGAASIEQRIRVDRRWVGPDAANVYPAGPDVRPCAAGVNWRWDGVRFRFLHPSAGAGVRGNDSSCVLRVEGPGGRTLLTGDIEAPGEAALLAERARLATDLLVAPHHGSRTSSTAPFVAATAPRWVVFPAGFGNRWGFPAAEVRARWQRAGAGLWTTGEDGAVQVEFASAGVAGPPTGWRCRAPRAWRRARCATDAGRDRVPGAGDSQYDSADPVPRLSGP
jgi:competence protein ComEC